jgi:hypothetical protein
MVRYLWGTVGVQSTPSFKYDVCLSSLGAIDTSGHMKDAVYIADVIKRYLIEVGPENVVQICTDNANCEYRSTTVATLVLPGMHGTCIKSTPPRLGFTSVGKLCY